jgi:hypothetical protein
MYAGNTVPTEWPRRADRSKYETYAKLPSWHVEEAASLAAALIPRQNFHLKFRPIHGVPGEPKPYEDASIGWVKRVQIGHIESVANEPVSVRGPSARAAEVLDLDVLHFRGCPPAAGLGCTSAIGPRAAVHHRLLWGTVTQSANMRAT